MNDGNEDDTPKACGLQIRVMYRRAEVEKSLREAK